MLRECVDRELDPAPVFKCEGLGRKIYFDPGARLRHDRRVNINGDYDRQQSILERVLFEDVGERRAHHRSEPELQQSPRRMLARAAAAEVVAGHQHLSVFGFGPVQREIRLRLPGRVVPPIVEELGAQAVFRNSLQKPRRDYLVCVDVIDRQHHGPGLEILEFHSSVLTSVITPVIAVAAAVSGLAKNVRPPAPWRPSKLRLLVDTQYSPGCNWSPFIAMHIEHPASLKSAPASRKMRSNPSACACALTC